MKYFSTYYSSKAIIAYFIVLMVCAWLFVPRFLPFIWILFGAVAVFSFFYFSTLLSSWWAEINSTSFRKKIFINGLIIRVIYVILIYFFYQSKTGQPFEFSAGDSIGYHIEAEWFMESFYFRGGMQYYFQNLRGYSDAGWPVFMGMIYIIFFKSIIIVRLVNALFSAWTVVLIYKIGQRNFGEKAARISAVMAMLLPSFIFYSGLHLKETLMVFLLMAFIERADYLLHIRNFPFKNIVIVIILGASLFFFRTVLAVGAWFALFSAFLLSSKKLMSQYKRVIIIIWLTVASGLILSGNISSEIFGYLGERNSNQDTRYEFFSTRKGANKLAKYGSTAIFIPIIIPAPFPTLVNLPLQQNQMMINGDLFTRNVYVFFVFVAFYVLFKKKKIKESLLLSVFLGTYLLILANSGFALSPRFHVPALPFFLLFAGYGITQITRQSSSYYVLYLIGISTLVVAWNYFKLAGRGLA